MKNVILVGLLVGQHQELAHPLGPPVLPAPGMGPGKSWKDSAGRWGAPAHFLRADWGQIPPKPSQREAIPFLGHFSLQGVSHSSRDISSSPGQDENSQVEITGLTNSLRQNFSWLQGALLFQLLFNLEFRFLQYWRSLVLELWNNLVWQMIDGKEGLVSYRLA